MKRQSSIKVYNADKMREAENKWYEEMADEEWLDALEESRKSFLGAEDESWSREAMDRLIRIARDGLEEAKSE